MDFAFIIVYSTKYASNIMLDDKLNENTINYNKLNYISFIKMQVYILFLVYRSIYLFNYAYYSLLLTIISL